MGSFQAITIVVSLLVCGFLYGVLDYVVEDAFEEDTSGWHESGQIRPTISLMSFVWDYIPLIVLAGCVVYGFATVQKEV